MKPDQTAPMQGSSLIWFHSVYMDRFESRKLVVNGGGGMATTDKTGGKPECLVLLSPIQILNRPSDIIFLRKTGKLEYKCFL